MKSAVSIEPEQVSTDIDLARPVEIVDVAGDSDKTITFTKTFTVTWRNLETGRVKTGAFTARRPALGHLGQIAVLKAKLNGGMAVDPETDFYHEMMAGLQVILVDFPDWWTPADFFTADPLRKVWDHVRSWIDSFHSKRAV
jgi:hypothetical protein